MFSDYANTPKIIRYDCREAHWHPDYPLEVKEECRRLMNNELKKIHQERKSKIIT